MRLNPPATLTLFAVYLEVAEAENAHRDATPSCVENGTVNQVGLPVYGAQAQLFQEGHLHSSNPSGRDQDQGKGDNEDSYEEETPPRVESLAPTEMKDVDIPDDCSAGNAERRQDEGQRYQRGLCRTPDVAHLQISIRNRTLQKQCQE